jgi:hypothetical protein
MTDDEIEQFLDSFDKSVKPLGCATFDEAVRTFFPWLSQFTERLSHFQDRNKARAWLRQLTPEAEQFKSLLVTLPQLVYLVRRIIPQAAKKMPHAPGGRPQEFLPAERTEICREINELHLKRVKLRAAFERIAVRHHVSTRTIQRIWNERTNE